MATTQGLYERIFEVYSGNLFEGPWMGETEIERSIMLWSEDAFPEWYDEADDQALNVEVLIRDEEGPDELDGFWDFLGPERLQEALELIRDELETDFQDFSPALDLVGELNDIIDQLPL